jgi:hypothetical protein
MYGISRLRVNKPESLDLSNRNDIFFELQHHRLSYHVNFILFISFGSVIHVADPSPQNWNIRIPPLSRPSIVNTEIIQA